MADTLRMGGRLNSVWDAAVAERVVREGGIARTARVGELSPGRLTRVALALALGKRPGLLLDEPLAGLDPVVRGEIMATLMAEAAEREVSIVLSSHVLPELEQTCGRVVLLRDGRGELGEDADALREGRALATAHVGEEPAPDGRTVVHRRAHGRRLTALVRPRGRLGGDWHVERPSLEEILLGPLRSGTDGPAGHRPAGDGPAGRGPAGSGPAGETKEAA